MTSIDWHQVASRREKLLFVAFMVGIAVFFFQGVFFPKSAEVNLLRSRLEALSMEKNALLKFMATTPSVAKGTFRKGASLKFKILEGEVHAESNDLPVLLSRLTELKFLQGVHVEGLSFQPAVAETGVLRTDFILETAGSFGQMVSYLERLEQYPALFEVRDLVLSVNEENKGEVKAEISCHFFKKGGKGA